jgi:hypothetical protein
MTALPNLDHVDDIDRGELQQAEAVAPSDTGTQARIDWQAAGIGCDWLR